MSARHAPATLLTIALLVAGASTASGADLRRATFAGSAGAGGRIALTVRDGIVVRVRIRVPVYRCEVFGDLGEQRLDVAPGARVGRDGHFGFSIGSGVRRLRITADLDPGRRRLRGRARIDGTIAIGQRCTTGTLRLRASRRSG